MSSTLLARNAGALVTKEQLVVVLPSDHRLASLAEIDPQVLTAKVAQDQASVANLRAQLADRQAQAAMSATRTSARCAGLRSESLLIRTTIWRLASSVENASVR